MEKNAEWFTPFLDLSGQTPKATKAAAKWYRTAYAQVCTRCFGIAFTKAAMVPCADNLNHWHTHSGVHLMNKTLHLRPLSVEGYFSKELFLTDVRSVWSEQELDKIDADFVKGFDGENPKF